MMEFLKDLRKGHLKKRRERDPNLPVSTWIGDDILSNGKVGRSITVILNTPGCRWAYKYGGCTMCGYLMDGSPGEVSPENIINQFNYAIERYYKEIEDNPKNICIKIFTSGSFLDDREVPREARRYILSKIGELDIREVVIESRPEYIREDTLEEAKECLGSVNMEIGVGVETFNEEIRRYSINKGISNRDIL
ncbi:TIGR01210 family radical SAM protein, partial [Methanothermococcus sp. SCGC AD-155-N22]|nr:TIGR01210 family radical SAM protein [Methanothermococcus sp. SCGC AD-155-N22]